MFPAGNGCTWATRRGSPNPQKGTRPDRTALRGVGWARPKGSPGGIRTPNLLILSGRSQESATIRYHFCRTRYYEILRTRLSV
jgi:hypothetical protein